jgi:hypothetical protein
MNGLTLVDLAIAVVVDAITLLRRFRTVVAGTVIAVCIVGHLVRVTCTAKTAGGAETIAIGIGILKPIPRTDGGVVVRNAIAIVVDAITDFFRIGLDLCVEIVAVHPLVEAVPVRVHAVVIVIVFGRGTTAGESEQGQ